MMFCGMKIIILVTVKGYPLARMHVMVKPEVKLTSQPNVQWSCLTFDVFHTFSDVSVRSNGLGIMIMLILLYYLRSWSGFFFFMTRIVI